MNVTRRGLFSLAGLGIAGLAACERPQVVEEPPVEEEPPAVEEPPEPQVDLDEFEDLAIDMSAWHYDETNDCYYQLGLPYCLNAGSEQYESLSIYVPGPYFTGVRHGQTYECTIVPEAEVGSFMPETAPVAMPLNSKDCTAQECPLSYSYEGLGRYLEAGMVYVYPGFRGRSGGYESTTQEYFPGGAPWPVADLKAAVRCLRYNAAQLPFDASRIFAFGFAASGGLASLLGLSGNAATFDPYLAEIGAATHDIEGTELTDEICGVATWCPQVSLGVADGAYEWMMGQYASDDARSDKAWTGLLSQDLADAYGDYLNGLGLVDADGAPLTLDRIDDGTYASGSYYDYLVDLVSDAASAFFSSTSFPLAVLPEEESSPVFPGDPNLGAPADEETPVEDKEDEAPTASGVRQVQATVYDTLESYVTSLNGDSRWLTYNASRGQADVTGLWGYARACRPAQPTVGIFDAIDRSSAANQLFGTDDFPSLHFSSMVCDLIAANHERYAKRDGWNEDVVSEWRGDLVETDVLDNTVTYRAEMASHLDYLRGDDELAASAKATHWRINTGLMQSRTTLAGEVNLALALAACKEVSDVAFEAVWDAGFALAERSGSAEGNLVEWIVSCCPEPERPQKEEDQPDQEVPAEDAEGEQAAEEEKNE